MYRFCLTGLLGLFASAGCFSPTITPCAVSCGAGDSCPSDTSCRADGFCHSPDDESVCNLPLFDAGADAATPFDATAIEADARVGCGDGVIDPDSDEECDDSNPLSSDGCSDECLVEPGFICVGNPTSECHRAPGEGQLIITEIHKDPTGTQDIFGEWFEIHNPSVETYQLLNTVIADEDGMSGEQITINVPLTIGPLEHLVLGNNGNAATNGGVFLDFAYPTLEYSLANNGDEIVLIEPFALVEIDRVDYDDTNFPNTSGRSLSLSSDTYSAVSNDIGANWCDGQTAFGDGNLGTPGQANPVCP